MKESAWQDLCLGQQDTIDDLKYKLSFLTEKLSNTANRQLDELVANRRKVIKSLAQEYDEDAVLRAKQLENQKKNQENE